MCSSGLIEHFMLCRGGSTHRAGSVAVAVAGQPGRQTNRGGTQALEEEVCRGSCRQGMARQGGVQSPGSSSATQQCTPCQADILITRSHTLDLDVVHVSSKQMLTILEPTQLFSDIQSKLCQWPLSFPLRGSSAATHVVPAVCAQQHKQCPALRQCIWYKANIVQGALKTLFPSFLGLAGRLVQTGQATCQEAGQHLYTLLFAAAEFDNAAQRRQVSHHLHDGPGWTFVQPCCNAFGQHVTCSNVCLCISV